MKMLSEQFIATLMSKFNSSQIRTNPIELDLYSYDSLQLHKATPACVVLPKSTEEISWLVKICNEFNIPYVPRGSGTGLSGGAVIDSGLIIQMSLLRRQKKSYYLKKMFFL